MSEVRRGREGVARRRRRQHPTSASSAACGRTPKRRFRKNKLAVGGLVIVIIFLIAAIIGPHIAPYDFLEQKHHARLPGSIRGARAGHGRPGQRRVQPYAAWRSHGGIGRLFSPPPSAWSSAFLVGAWSGIRGGRADELLMWITDLISSRAGLAAGHPYQHDPAPSHHQRLRHDLYADARPLLFEYAVAGLCAGLQRAGLDRLAPAWRA